MTMRDSIEIDLNSIPYSFDVDIEDDTYTLTIQYNEILEQYTVDLAFIDGTKIISGEPMILGVPLWYGRSSPDLPVWSIVPMDESGQADRVSPDNLEQTVFLLIDDMGDDEDGI